MIADVSSKLRAADGDDKFARWHDRWLRAMADGGDTRSVYTAATADTAAYSATARAFTTALFAARAACDKAHYAFLVARDESGLDRAEANWVTARAAYAALLAVRARAIAEAVAAAEAVYAAALAAAEAEVLP